MNGELKDFKEVYKKLENISLEIMKVYGLGGFDFDGFEIEDDNLIIKTFSYYRGCGREDEQITFDLEEMYNDIDYFKSKREEEVEQKKIAEKELKAEKERVAQEKKEAKEKADYDRLKAKFGD